VPRPSPDDEDDSGGNPLANVEVQALTPAMAQDLGVPGSVRGVVVTKVDPGGGTGELRPGDVIEEVNQQPVTSVQDYQKAIQAVDPREPQVLSVCRQRTRSFVVIRPR
jgi:serine protease Do